MIYGFSTFDANDKKYPNRLFWSLDFPSVFVTYKKVSNFFINIKVLYFFD